jgi:hypothetical protein
VTARVLVSSASPVLVFLGVFGRRSSHGKTQEIPCLDPGVFLLFPVFSIFSVPCVASLVVCAFDALISPKHKTSFRYSVSVALACIP